MISFFFFVEVGKFYGVFVWTLPGRFFHFPPIEFSGFFVSLFQTLAKSFLKKFRKFLENPESTIFGRPLQKKTASE
jgi:hypothetical protein